MLLAARSLLEISGSPLTSASDAFTVARNVLVAHDATELVLAALCVELGSGYKITEQAPFHELVGYVVKKFHDNDDDSTQNARRGALIALNYARVRFKHHGDLLDPSTTYPLVEEALEVLDLLCQRAVGFPLRSLDAVIAVEHPDIAADLRTADDLILVGEYRDSLVSIARALSRTFWDYDIQGVTAGQAESEDALLLSGRGVDPASFLAMQRFLPKLYSPFHEPPEFNTREYGHEANWTEENARFCWNTALSVVLRLRHARSVPQAQDFYDEFEDVIEVSADSTTAHRFKGYPSADWPLTGEAIECKVNSMFFGKASGFYELKGDPDLNFSMPLLEANWICLTDHNLRDNTGFMGIGITDELWFSKQDVTVTYRENDLAKARKQYVAELSKPTGDDSIS